MSVRVANSRFIVSSKSALVYQRLLKNVSDFQGLGNRLIQEAEIAQSFRQTKTLTELSIILSNLPLSEYRLIGQYYLGWCGYCKGENTREVIEQVVEKSKTYKVKALVCLGAVEDANGDYASAAKYNSEALKYAHSPSLIAQASRGVALLKAKQGDNRQALKEIENIWPVVKRADSHVYHQYLNSFAVELGEAGRIVEAQDICRVLLASPYAFTYPEWRETGQELALRGYKSRSVISVLKPALDKNNVVPLPVVESSPSPIKQGRARVLSYMDWINNMVKEQNDEPNDENIDEMDRKDLLVKLLELTTVEDIDEEKLRKVVKYTVEVMTKK